MTEFFSLVSFFSFLKQPFILSYRDLKNESKFMKIIFVLEVIIRYFVSLHYMNVYLCSVVNVTQAIYPAHV